MAMASGFIFLTLLSMKAIVCASTSFPEVSSGAADPSDMFGGLNSILRVSTIANPANLCHSCSNSVTPECEVCVSDMSCTNLHLENLELMSNNGAWHFALRNAFIACDANWFADVRLASYLYFFYRPFSESGIVELNNGPFHIDASSVNVDIDLYVDPASSAVTFGSCASSLTIPEIVVFKSASGPDPLDIFMTVIVAAGQNSVVSALDNIVCTSLKELAVTKAQALLDATKGGLSSATLAISSSESETQVADFILEGLPNQGKELVPLDSGPGAEFEVPTALVNTVFATNGILLHHSIAAAVNKTLIANFLGNLISSEATLTRLALQELEISAVDISSNCPYCFRFTFQLPKIDVEAEFTTVLTNEEGSAFQLASPVNMASRISCTLLNVSIDIGVFVGLPKDMFAPQGLDPLDPSLRPFVNITHVLLSAEDMTGLTASGVVDEGTTQLLNNATSAIVLLVKPQIRALLANMVLPPELRVELNQLAGDKIQPFFDLLAAAKANTLPVADDEQVRIAAIMAQQNNGDNFVSLPNLNIVRILRVDFLDAVAAYNSTSEASAVNDSSSHVYSILPPKQMMSVIGSAFGDLFQDSAGQRGTLSLKLDFEPFAETELGYIKLKSLDMERLASISYVNAMYAVPGCESCLGFKVIFHQLDLNVTMESRLTGVFNESQAFIQTSLQDVEFDVHFFVGIRESALSTIKVGKMVESPLDCLSHLLSTANVTSFKIKIGNMTSPIVTLTDAKTSEGISNAFSIFLPFVKPLISQYLGSRMLTDVAELIMGRLMRTMRAADSSTGSCFAVNAADASDFFLNLFEFQRIPVVSSFLATIGAFVAKHGIDFSSIVSKLLANEAPDSASGVFGYGYLKSIFSREFNLPDNSILYLEFSRLLVEGLGNVHQLTIFNATGPYSFNSRVKLGSKELPVTFSLASQVGMKRGGTDAAVMRDSFHINGSFVDDELQAEVYLKVDLRKVYDMSLLDAIQHPLCFAYSIADWGIMGVTMQTERGVVSLQCDDASSCSSPELPLVGQRLGHAIYDRNNSTSGPLGWVIDSLADPKGPLRSVPRWTEEAVYPSLDSALASNCPWHQPGDFAQPAPPVASPSPAQAVAVAVSSDSSASEAASRGPVIEIVWPFDGLTTILVGVAACAGLVCLCFSVRPISQIIKKIASCSCCGKGNAAISASYDIENQLETSVSQSGRVTTSLFLNRRLPLCIRVMMPLMSVGLVGLFFVAHTAMGASIDLGFKFAGQVIVMPFYKTITLSNAIRQALDAGAYIFAFIIALLSGVWPYIKILLQMIAWFSKSHNHMLLTIIHNLAKVSQIDLFILVLTMIIFSLTVSSPEGFGVFLAGFLQVRVDVQPQQGLVCFVIASCLSMLQSQIIHLCSHWIQHGDIKTENTPEAPEESIDLEMGSMNTRQAVPSATSACKDDVNEVGQLRSWTCNSVIRLLMALVLAVLLYYGFTLPLATITYGGMGGRALAWSSSDGSIKRVVEISLQSIVSGIAPTIEDTLRPTLYKRFIQISLAFLTVGSAGTYLFTTVATIAFHFLILCMAKVRSTRWVALAAKAAALPDLIGDYISIDVFLLAFGVMLVEMKALAASLAADMDPICRFMQEIVVDSEGEACFTVESSFGSGSAMLLALAIGIMCMRLLPSRLSCPLASSPEAEMLREVVVVVDTDRDVVMLTATNFSKDVISRAVSNVARRMVVEDVEPQEGRCRTTADI